MKASKVAMIGFCASAGISAGVVACSPPQMYCTSAYGHFAVVLDLKDSSGDCENAPVDLSAMSGEQAYLETYADPRPNGEADWSQGNLVIKTLAVGDFEATARGRGVEIDPKGTSARGEFTTSNPSDEGFCEVNFSQSSALDIEELPADEDPTPTSTTDDADLFPGQPAIDMTVEWSNMTIYATPDAQGTQFEADVSMELNGCSASFKAVGLYPQVYCATDDDCEDAKSGINPSFDVKCDENSGMCTLAKAMPSYED